MLKFQNKRITTSAQLLYYDSALVVACLYKPVERGMPSYSPEVLADYYGLLLRLSEKSVTQIVLNGCVRDLVVHYIEFP